MICSGRGQGARRVMVAALRLCCADWQARNQRGFRLVQGSDFT
ncbi:hypothetical protein PAMC26577_14520 [Caballeronia sordidicola]|uniref:Uncharacterized protein n=1 Tax=Caballeronia sordidicola TaxID=196367 RepID=A0A242MUR9_CABSO|nr:hypothetical protein PAMC26577_14520 [Caballeronia sordidicola]